MALQLLVDENISAVIAEQINAKRPDILIQSIHTWHEGAYLNTPDETILLAAHSEGLTLVTYDVQILSDLAFLFDSGVPTSGLIFVDVNTIANNDFGALVRALIALWDHESTLDWSNRLVFLQRPPAE